MPANKTSRVLAGLSAVVAMFVTTAQAADAEKPKTLRLSERAIKVGKATYISVEESVGRAAPLKFSRGMKSSPLLAVRNAPAKPAASSVLVSHSAGLVSLGDEASPFLLAALQESQDTSDLAKRINDLLRDGMLTQEMAADLLGKLGRKVPGGVSQPAVQQADTTAFTRAVREPDRPVALAMAGGKPAIVVSGEPAPAVTSPVPQYAPQYAPAQPVAQATEVAAEAWVLTREDRTLKNAFERWAREANWMLSWEYPTDFQVEFDAQFEGDLIDAVAKVIDGLGGLQRPIRAEFYGGNRVLRILSGRE